MQIDLTDVLKSEEKVVEKEFPYKAEEFSCKGEVFSIIKKTPVFLKITNKGEQELEIALRIKLITLNSCGRCLEETRTEVVIDTLRKVDMKLEAVKEENYIDGYNLKVDKLVNGEILLKWPVKVLCKESCKGLCKTCGVNLNQETCVCEHTDLDPRMAKIRNIFSEFKEV